MSVKILTDDAMPLDDDDIVETPQWGEFQIQEIPMPNSDVQIKKLEEQFNLGALFESMRHL